jgi:hypothetical protein
VSVGDLATLLSALGTFGTFVLSSAAFVIGWQRNSTSERKGAAENAAERAKDVAEVATEKAFDKLLEKLVDGQLTADEVEEIREDLHPRHRKELDG